MRRLFSIGRFSLALVFGLSAFAIPGSPQKQEKYTTLSNTQVEQMLDTIESDIKEHYYNPTLHGLDLTKRFEEARQKIAASKSQNESLLHVAGAVAALNDSHTSFIPPSAPYGVEYGWRAEAIGDSACFVTHVLPDSDASAKGLRPGDQLVSVNGVTLTRKNLSALEYGYRVFPQSGLHLVVRSPDGDQRQIVAMAKILPGQEFIRHADVMTWYSLHAHDLPKDRSRYHKEGNVLFWKLPDFVVDPAIIEGSLNKIRSSEVVALDLRGNPGGLLAAVDKLVGGFFPQDVQLGVRKTRKGSEPLIAKTRGAKAFRGKLIVLVDSKSASGAEIFARLIQIEKRGVVVGDRSAGAVMESQFFPHAVSLSPATLATYGAMITQAELTMADGSNLEGAGVTPDERVLPTPQDIATGNDPAMARAAELAGLKISASEAGKIFPYEWPKEKMPEID
jgi:C-terminal processing protease CtpA/Prc